MNNIEILKKLYNNYTKKFLPKILFSIFFSLLVAGSTAAIAWLLDPAIKKIFIEKDQTLIFLIPAAIILAFTTKGISLYIAKTTLIKVGQEVTKILQLQLMKSIIKADAEIIDKKHSGKFISHLNFDISMMTNLVSVVILNIAKDSLTLIGLIGVMFYQNWKLAIFAIFMIPLAAGLAKSLGKKIGKAQGEAGEIAGTLTSFLSDIFRGSRMIRIYQKEEAENKNATKVISSLIGKNIRIASIMIRATPIMETLTGFMIAGFIFYSGKLINAGELELNNFFSFLAAMMLAYQPIRSLATIHMVAYQGGTAANRIFSVIDVPIKIKDEDHLPELQIKNCEIKFNNVNFKYKSTNEKAINNINLKIEGGKITALVGQSGAGKSTIVNLIPRFYDPQDGEITIDNQNTKKIRLKSLRKRISLVSQDVILFDDTIKNNIAYADPKASEESIQQACKFAAADEFIEKLPKKYDTIVGENGIRLSGGQKQRISIARAILKKSPIILLDEATSSLDTEAERIVQHAINNLIKGRTTIIIAHRLSTIHSADKIFLMKKGEIIDSGNHEQLIQNSEEYKSLYKNQLK